MGRIFPARAGPVKIIAALILCVPLFACGIESYVALDQVSESSISRTGERAIIRFSNIPAYPSRYFRNFMIYYRIYLSTRTPSGGTIPTTDFSSINSTLAYDYASLLPYTNPDNTNSLTNVASQFSSKNYYPLSTIDGRGVDIIDSEILYNANSEDLTLEIGNLPYIQATYGSAAPVFSRGSHRGLVMHRSTGGGIFTTYPNQLFVATSGTNGLLTTTPSSTVNRDVAPVSGGGTATYAYICLYIFAVGINEDLTPIYSRPTFIGVFALDPP
jgi:hypothetical protein